MSTTGPPDGLDSPAGKRSEKRSEERPTTPIRRQRAAATPGPTTSSADSGDAAQADTSTRGAAQAGKTADPYAVTESFDPRDPHDVSDASDQHDQGEHSEPAGSGPGTGLAIPSPTPPPTFGDPARGLPPPTYGGGPADPAAPGSPFSPPPVAPPPPTYGGDPGAWHQGPARPPAGHPPHGQQPPTGQPPGHPPAGHGPVPPPAIPSPLDSPAFGPAPSERPALPPGEPAGPLEGLPAAGADWYGLGPAAGTTAGPGPGHRAPPPAWDQVEDWLQPAKPRRSVPRPSGTVLAVAAALVIVVAAGTGGYVLLSGRRTAPSPPPTTAAGIADTIFAAGPGAPTDGLAQQVDDVAAAGGLVVAAGAESGAVHAHPRFLFSADAGRTWRLAQVESEGGDGPLGATPQRLVGGPSGWLALSAPGTRVTAWTSQDGRTWRRLKEVIDAFRSGDQVRQLARTGQDSAAVGADGSGRPVLWLSVDARTWQRRDGSKLKLPLRRKEKVRRLTYVAGSGRTLLVAGDLATGKTTRAGLWRSEDGGQTWEEVDAPAEGDAFGPLHLAVDGTKFYALRKGKDGERRKGVVFESGDGKSWQVRGEIPLPEGQDQSFSDLSAGSQQLAVLADATGGPDAATVVYGSSDGGASWRQTGAVRREPGRTVNGMAAAAGGVAVVGGERQQQSTGQDFYLAVTAGSGDPREVDLGRVPGAVSRERSVRDLVVTGGRAVAVGSTNGDAAVWSSTDGTAWRRADTAALGGTGLQTLTGLVGGAHGWMAFGRDQGKPLVAFSQDGASWQKLDAPELTGESSAVFNGASGGPKGYVLVGTVDGAPAAWTSTDLRTWKRGDSGLESSDKKKGGSPPVVADVAATGTGFIAVGASSSSGPREGLPEVWTSDDGATWKAKRPPLPPEATAGALTRVAVRGNTVVAAGVASFTGDRAFTLVSDDAGLTWQAARLPLSVTGRPSYASAVTATAGGFAVAGNLGGSVDGDVLVWTAADGRTWKVSAPRGAAVSGGGLQRLLGIAGIGGHVVGVGFTTEPRTEHVTLWRGPAG